MSYIFYIRGSIVSKFSPSLPNGSFAILQFARIDIYENDGLAVFRSSFACLNFLLCRRWTIVQKL